MFETLMREHAAGHPDLSRPGTAGLVQAVVAPLSQPTFFRLLLPFVTLGVGQLLLAQAGHWGKTGAALLLIVEVDRDAVE